MNIPRVFISYSHDNESHKRWVNKLATVLRQNGVDVLLDQWELRLGDNLVRFMEQSVSGSDRVLVISTDNYVSKANGNKGGVGYEKMIVSSELLKDLNTNKFIPVVRKADSNNKLPICLSGRLFIDMSNDSEFEFKIEELLREIHNEPILTKPQMGSSPFKDGHEKVPRVLTSKRTEDFINNLNSIYRIRKDPQAPPYVKFIDDIYTDFDKIHEEYLHGFREISEHLKRPNTNLNKIIETLKEQYLFSETQRSKLREFIRANDLASDASFEKYLKNEDKQESKHDPDWYPNQFFHGIYLYLTAGHAGGFDQRWYRGIIDQLSAINNDDFNNGLDRYQDNYIIVKTISETGSKIEAVKNLVYELIRQLIEWHAKVTHDYYKIKD